MKTTFAVTLAALALPLAAQWSYPTAGIPRAKDGKPNLSAPAPRLADGKPDFSGVWDVDHNKPCPKGGCNDFWTPWEFTNVGWNLVNGLPSQPWAMELAQKRSAAQRLDDPLSHCLPIGLIESQTIPLYRKVLHTPGLMVILHEYNTSYRQIFTDGRPKPEDPQPSWMGYSTAKWDGDTLVVETSGFRDGIWMDTHGDPVTDAAKITERIRRPDIGHLNLEITVDDPKAYTKPFTFRLIQNLQLDTDLIDYVCLENEKDLPHMVGPVKK